MGAYLHETPDENVLVRAIHTAVKGRARYKVNGLYSCDGLKIYLELRLSEEKIIEQVRANPVTGNVLIFFHRDKSANAIALLIQGIVLDYRKEIRKLPVRTGYINIGSEKEKFNQEISYVQKQKFLPWYVWGKDSVYASLNTSLIMVSGAVCSLVLCTGLVHGYGLDKGILLAIQKLHTPIGDRVMLGITFLGEPVFLLLVCLGLASNLLHSNCRSEATNLAITAVGAGSLNCLLKILFGRARPALWDRIIDVGLHSFPSGHAMVSIAIYGFIAYILAKEFPQWRERIFALTVVLILAIGFSRLYLGVHWPTDVVAGYAAGLVWLAICIQNLERRKNMAIVNG